MKETAKFETITPEIAEQLLENNKLNRPVNRRNLDKIVFEMERDNFHITGESIKIAENGSLLDGQHRLWAILKTGKSFTIPVIRGLAENAFKYMDTGRSRRPSDVLAIEGIAHPGAISAMCKFIINFQRSNFYAVVREQNNDRRNLITNWDISDFVAKHNSGLQESYHYGYNKYNKFIPGSILASFHYLFNKISEAGADEFCHSLAEGQNLNKTSPIYLLREKLIADVRATRKMGALEKMALICKAWNAYRQKKTFTILRWDSVKEPFPKPL